MRLPKFSSSRVLIFAFALGAFFLSSTSLWAKTPEQIRAQCAKEHRPCIGLVLSGGGARGFAHVGVLKAIESLGIPVDVVTGTSMGAMIGGAWAAGYSAQEIEEIVVGVNWNRMLSSRPMRQELPWRYKLQDYKGLLPVSLEVSADGQVELPKSVVASQELDLFIQNNTGRFDNIHNLSNLSIPFACVATNLVSGHRVVLQKNVTLGKAMRASMSVPGAFAPVNLHGELLVDGGLVDNLPVQLARDMGADIIIAVNVGTPLFKRKEIDNVFAVLTQMVNLLTEQNVRKSLSELTKKDVLITPDLKDVTSADLEEGRRIIEIGLKAALAKDKRLKSLGLKPEVYAKWQAKYHSLPTLPKDKLYPIERVEVKGLTTLNPEVALKALDIETPTDMTRPDIDMAARRLWGEGFFNGVNYTIEPGPNRTNVLVFDTQQKSPRYSRFKVGGSIQTDFNQTHNYHFVLSHTLELVNSWGADWHNEIELGEDPRLTTSFFQPLGPGSQWFVMPKLEVRRQPFNLYDGKRIVAEYRNQEEKAELAFGRGIGFSGYLKGTVGFERQSTRAIVGSSAERFTRTRTPYVGVGLWLDTLDNLNFPTSGYRLSAEFRRQFIRSNDTHNHNMYTLEGLWAISQGPWTVLVNGKFGRASMPNVYHLGGAFELPGAPIGRWTGSDLQYGGLRLARNMSDIVNLWGQPLWVGATVELGRAWNRTPIEGQLQMSNDDRWHRSVGAYLGVDSFLGPLYLIGGHAIGTGSSLYFYWGRSF